MTLDTKATEVAERLEKLAVMLGEGFLKETGDREKIMSLYDHEPEVLNFVKKKLDEYFLKKGKDVVVQIGKNQGYPVDVGFFTSNNFAQ